MEEEVVGCPCCGTRMQISSQVGSKQTLVCPSCRTSEVRIRPG